MHFKYFYPIKSIHNLGRSKGSETSMDFWIKLDIKWKAHNLLNFSTEFI